MDGDTEYINGIHIVGMVKIIIIVNFNAINQWVFFLSMLSISMNLIFDSVLGRGYQIKHIKELLPSLGQTRDSTLTPFPQNKLPQPKQKKESE